MESPSRLLLAITVLTFFTSSYGKYCSEIYSKYNDWNQQSCHCENNASPALTWKNSNWVAEYRQIINNSLSFEVDKVTGEGIVKFDLPEQHCAYPEFSIELRYINASDEYSCLEASQLAEEDNSEDDNGALAFHSIQEYLTHASSSLQPACKKNAEIHFFYIFTGCYYITITPKAHPNKSTRQVESKYYYIVTDVKKKDVEIYGKDVSKVAIRYVPASSSLVPRFSLALPAGSTAKTGPMLVELQLRRDVDPSRNFSCTTTGREHDCCVMRENSSTGVCRSNSKEETQYCSFNKDTIQCTFDDVKPGNYCALMVVHDARCEHSSLWSTNSEFSCLWTHTFAVSGTGVVQVDERIVLPTSRWPVWVVLGLVVTVIFIALMYGLYVLLTIARRGQLPESNLAVLTVPCDFVYTDLNINLDPMPCYSYGWGQDLCCDRCTFELVTSSDECPLINGQGQKLLLLYARDCDAFMDLMHTFRGLLQKYCKCEVLDCYDEANQQEIFTREHDWILGHMNHVPMTDLKVVLVATECSAAHQLAQCGARGPVEYCDPDPCDKIFPLALKLLKEDVNPGLYTRINLVEFSGFKIVNESPTLFPNPFTRFVLPTSFKDLICSIRGLTNNNLLNTCDDDLKKLNSQLDDLLQYKKDNPSYLQSVIS